MREIKFRTWNGTVMDYDPILWGSHELGECWINAAIKAEQEEGTIFMQYIGRKDEEGNTFLHKVAVCSGDAKVMELLLGQGPDLAIKNGEGQTVEQVIQANDSIAYVF